MRISLFLLSGLVAVTSLSAADSAPAAPGPLVFPGYGFRINALDAGTDMATVPAVQMYLPSFPLPSDPRLTFAPNVYVQIVPTLGGMKEYIKDSKDQMAAQGYIIRGEISPTADEWDVEYIAIINGMPMHWYAKAAYSGHRVYYAAGGVPDEMWTMSITSDKKTLGDKLKECVNSLGVTGTAPELKVIPAQNAVPAPAPAAGSAPVPAKATAAPAKATGTSAK